MTKEREARRGVIFWFTFGAIAVVVSIAQVLEGRDAWQAAIVPAIVTVAGCANAHWLRRLKTAKTRQDSM